MEYHIVKLPNGEVHTLMNYGDFKHLVENKLGYDCSKIVDELIDKSEITQSHRLCLSIAQSSIKDAIEELDRLMSLPITDLHNGIEEVIEGLKIINEIYN